MPGQAEVIASRLNAQVLNATLVSQAGHAL
jgi:hypothetical protein